MYTVDFETEAIERRPNYPPRPVSVAVKAGAGRVSYSEIQSVDAIPQALQRAEGGRWLCHNASFDVAVAVERMGLEAPDRIDDTLFLAFLLDPYGSHALKDLALRYLGIAPDERDAVRQWLEDNKVVRKGTKKAWAAHISKAPASIRRPYNIADVDMTYALYKALLPRVKSAGMLAAYEREVALAPMLLDMEQQGVPLDAVLLANDLTHYEAVYERVNKQIISLLGQKIDLDKPQQLAWALNNIGVKLPLTRTGKLSTAKDTLLAHVPDGKLKGFLLYRSALGQSLKTFLRPWAEQMRNGVVHVHWNQVKGGSHTRDAGGALSGRLSSEPNFQNLTTGEKRDDQLALISKHIKAKCDLPEIRSYVCAPPGYVLLGRDYNQQELRFTAHYENGPLCAEYNKSPDLDVHKFVQDLITRVWRELPRKIVKNVNFGKIYGLGAKGLSSNTGMPYEEAAAIIKAHRQALPSLDQLMREDGAIGRTGGYIETIGGRKYYCEPARFVDDGSEVPGVDEDAPDPFAVAPGGERDVMTFEYRMLNRRIQGSAADQTKQAMVNWKAANPMYFWGARMVLQVHDELIVMAPAKSAKPADAVLRECMHGAFKLRVPVVTKPAKGQRWSEMK